MRIMHVIDSLEIGGAERMLVDLANAAASDGHEVSVCATRGAGALARELHPDIRLWALGRSRRLDIRAMRRFASLVTANCVEVLHAHGRSTFSLLVVARTLGLVRRPIVFHDHFGSIELDASVPLWFRVWGRRFAAQYVAVSSQLLEWAKNAGVPEERRSLIENALDLRRLLHAEARDVREELRIPAEIPIGIVVGGIRHEKGVDVLLEALAMSAFRAAVKVLIVGGDRDSAYLQKCKAQRSELKLEDSVLFLGERNDAAGLMKCADFALVPSRSESGPLVLIEYLANGLPFVATRVGAISERLAQLRVPEFVDPGDPKALAEAMDRLLQLDKELRLERGSIGREIAIGHFDVTSTMQRWYEVYGLALGRGLA